MTIKTIAHAAYTCLAVACFAASTARAAAKPSPVETALKQLADDGTDANTLFSLTFYFESAGRPFSAITAAERAAAKNPKVPGYHARLGQLLAARKRFRDAAAAYAKACEIDAKTKSFRAAQARALESCHMYAEAIKPWQFLLDQATDVKEILDSAQNLEDLYKKLHRHDATDAVWRQALGKVPKTDWKSVITCASNVADALKRQDRILDAVKFWSEFAGTREKWEERVAAADRFNAMVRDYSEDRTQAIPLMLTLWQSLLKTAPSTWQKQRMAIKVAQAYIHMGEFDSGLMVLDPLLFASTWDENFGVVKVATQLHLLKGDAKAAVALARKALETAKTGKQGRAAVQHLVKFLPETEHLQLYKSAAERFADSDVHDEYGKALENAGKYEDAVNVYERARQLTRQQKNHYIWREDSLRNALVRIYARTGAFERLAQTITRDFADHDDIHDVRGWFRIIERNSTRGNAIEVAIRCGGATPILARGAAEYLNQVSRNDDAEKVLRQQLDAKGLHPKTRLAILEQLARQARGNVDKELPLREEIVRHGESNPKVWHNGYYRNKAFERYVALLAEDGQVAKAVDVVMARYGKDKSVRSAENAITAAGRNLIVGYVTGPGLRTQAGVKAAVAATERMMKGLGTKDDFAPYSVQWLRNLSTICEGRGMSAEATRLLTSVLKMSDSSVLAPVLADHYRRIGKLDDAVTAYRDYLDRRAREIKKDQFGDTSVKIFLKDADGLGFVRVHGDLIEFATEHKKRETLDRHLRDKALATEDDTALCYAILALSVARDHADLDAMQAMLKAYEGRPSAPRLAGIKLWVENARKMNNASSQADTTRRDELVKALRDHKKRWAANPEDYEAAIKIYKTYVRLGKGKNGLPYLDKALSVKNNDPIILERYGRERMLIKDYGTALKIFEKAAEITGRRSDYEESLVSAYELAGGKRKAMEIAVDSLMSRTDRGRVVRSADNILDQAQRSNQLPALAQVLKEILTPRIKSNASIPFDAVTLSLNVAWEQNDEALAKVALSALSANVDSYSDWKINSLIRTTEGRNRLGHAIELHTALLKKHQNRLERFSPKVMQIARLMQRSGRSTESAETLLKGMRTHQQWTLLSSKAYPEGLGDDYLTMLRTTLATSPTGKKLRSVRSGWIVAILDIAAAERLAGKSDFAKACGDRLDAFVTEELAEIRRSPGSYSGALTRPTVLQAYDLWQKVTDAVKTEAQAEGASDDARFAYVDHLVRLARLNPKQYTLPKFSIDDVDKAGRQYLASSKNPMAKNRLAQLYVKQAADSDEAVKRHVAFPANLILKTVHDAVGSGKDHGILQKAMALAIEEKDYSRALDYAERLRDDRAAQKVLLLDRKTDGARTLILKELGDGSPPRHYVGAAQRCLTVETEDAAKLALELMDRFDKSYESYLQSRLSQKTDDYDHDKAYSRRVRMTALVRLRKLDDAMRAYFEALSLSPANPAGSGLPELVETFKKAGRAEELAVHYAMQVEKAPKNPNYRLGHATVLLAAGKVDAAVVAMRIAKALDPTLDTVKKLVEVLRQAEEYDLALKECQLWASNYPQDLDAWRAMAAIYKDVNDPKGELRARTMLVAVAPREATGCRAVAVTMAESKDYKRAVALFERAMELRPEEPFRMVDLAEALYMDKQYQRAAEVCERALSDDWNKGLSPMLRERVRRNVGSWKGTYEARAHSLLADIYTALVDTDKAARAKSQVPEGYIRPELKDAVPQMIRRLAARVEWIR